jgi:RND superfamily putative drug exporter
LGRWVFWPYRIGSITAPNYSANHWERLARWVVGRPGPILVACIVALAPLSIWGWSVPQRVTFDLLSELPPQRVSIQGSELLKRHFPVGEGGPVVVLAHRTAAGFDDPDKDVAARSMAAVFDLTKDLRSLEGVYSVRSIAEPLGDPPESSLSLRKRILRQHPLTKSVFLAQTGPYRGEIARFELVLNDNPFALEAIHTLSQIDARLRAEAARPGSFWYGADFVFTGTTAGIRDMRSVIGSDYWRITALVTAIVFGVIVVILRRPGICLYLIASVLFSYLVTIGATELFFRWSYGGSFVGLDWKVPIFLFVILVAVGEDYNIYLVTRMLEEQQQLGPFAGLRAAVSRTGGIITSCGIIMAGSFVSMFSSSMRGISELGFALTLGILLDTFVVRTVLVPAFLALLYRFQLRAGSEGRTSDVETVASEALPRV